MLVSCQRASTVLSQRFVGFGFKLRPEKLSQTSKYHSGIQYYAFLSSSELYATSAASYPSLLQGSDAGATFSIHKYTNNL